MGFGILGFILFLSRCELVVFCGGVHEKIASFSLQTIPHSGFLRPPLKGGSSFTKEAAEIVVLVIDEEGVESLISELVKAVNWTKLFWSSHEQFSCSSNNKF
ncbi:uncharacterized protein LOC127744448 [Arachis duranensis]|uniref:Uncharacterized protein LOC127744390 n=2 Tax=Arachis TaxID=3817 RepID=A0A9C6T9R3_ARADU|nr:uncharacterized protein LOC127744390 [Arachis duranensis]XP_052112556.1 uncharacterized protein LOC127744448 [Arachis duranensis]RYR38931.1 hypothetical protein Ahy_A09g044253 [Arachis hypogaea]